MKSARDMIIKNIINKTYIIKIVKIKQLSRKTTTTTINNRGLKKGGDERK